MLIGAGVSFDPDVPSPAQFNHLITYLPGSGKPLWLDATPEAVPFQMLSAVLRGHKALVIPDTGAPSVMTTPEGLPFASEERMDVTGKLDGKGTLTAHFDWRFRGDSEVAVRSAFRTAGPAKWPELVQSMLPGLGFGGTASSVSVDNPANTDGPFHFSYDYRRETYSDWANLRIIPPFGRFGLRVPLSLIRRSNLFSSGRQAPLSSMRLLAFRKVTRFRFPPEPKRKLVSQGTSRPTRWKRAYCW